LGKSAEGRAIKMIVVGVGDEDEINGRKVTNLERGSEQATRAGGPEAQADADAVGEDGIGEDGHVADAEENGCMADPDGGEVLLVPVVQMGFWRRGGTVQAVEEAEFSASTAEPVRRA